MTLLVLSLVLPASTTEAGLAEGLASLVPAFGVYAFAFVVEFNWWRTHHNVLGLHPRVDRFALPFHAFVLLLVAAIPFTTDTWGRFPGESRAATLFGLHHVAITLVFLAEAAVAKRRGALDAPAARRTFSAFGIVLVFFLALALVGAVFPAAALPVGLGVALLYFIPFPGARRLWGGAA